VLPRGHVHFAPGQGRASVTVLVAADAVPELNEAFTVTLVSPQAGVSLGTAAATGVIMNDDFVSTAANEFLSGSAAPDLFLLGGGLDTVLGKGGADVFRVLPAALGPVAQSLIAFEGFNRAIGEVIDLSAIDAVAGTGANNAFAFIGTAAFSGVAGQLRWQSEGAVQRVQGDVNGDRIADLTLLVRAAGPLDAGWFVL
jgi:serralysin